MIARNRLYVLLVAGLVLIFVAGACLPGSTVSPPSPPEEVTPTTPPVVPTTTPAVPTTAPTNTPPVVEPGATPTQPPAGAAVRQWAVGGVASSSYSDPDWGAQQATGAPNVTGCVDDQRAWSPETADGVDWLEVSFATAVVPTEVNIHESSSPGFINKVEVKDETGLYYTVWEGIPGAVEECPRVLTVSVSGVSVRVSAVRISLDQRNGGDYNEIDAVELVGQP